MSSKILEAVRFGNNVVIRGDRVIVNEADKNDPLFARRYAEYDLSDAQPLIDNKTLVVGDNARVSLNACW